MSTNDCIKKVYAAIVAKQQAKIDIGGDKAEIVAIGNDIIGIGQSWTESLGDDGKISEAEEINMCATFDKVVDARIPNVDNWLVEWLWDGFTFFGIGFRGIKYYINKWWDLGL